MLVLSSPIEYRRQHPEGPLWVTLGTFDGLHLGHRHLLAELRRQAAGAPTLVLTFAEHPRQMLASQPVRPITPIAMKLALIERLGVQAVLVIEFGPELAATEPEDFVRDWLVHDLGASGVVLGYNNRFGRAGRGDFALLARLAGEHGFAAVQGTPLILDGAPVSSTRIRTAIERADFETAARLLGRLFAVRGTVVAGAGRGRTLGIPTANLDPGAALLPPPGVYGAEIEGPGLTRAPALVNLGVRPTFQTATPGDRAPAPRPVLEAHLIDYVGDLTGATLEIAFVVRLRAEQRFPDASALLRQIERDRQAFAAWRGAHESRQTPTSG